LYDLSAKQKHRPCAVAGTKRKEQTLPLGD